MNQMKMMTTELVPLTLFAVAMTACAATKRSPQAYRVATQEVLETRHAQIKRCYDAQLEKDATASGTVTIQFVVEKKTGAFTKATIDPSTSNAKEPLTLCVLEAVKGLRLDPPDANEGRAKFTYQLSPAVASR